MRPRARARRLGPRPPARAPGLKGGCIPQGLTQEAGTELSSDLSAEKYKDATLSMQGANFAKKPAPKPKVKTPEELKRAEEMKDRRNENGFLETGCQGTYASAW